ncbi:MAG TPA: exonuclease domain-containing protein [Xanthomonadales bacterium]|nr:exonuclease domain-containing protein [Xanthomonadales bacterium]
MLPDKIAFVDIETTGVSAAYDRIIEIGILRVENNVLVKTFHSLIDPQTFIPKEIELLTGISPYDLEKAPTFREIKDDIQEILKDCVFVAHNVRFDYGFLKNEFRRINISFSTKHFCTVRLSRLLYPSHKHHNLDAIIQRYNFECKNRHRALDDAAVLFDFYKMAHDESQPDAFEQAVSRCLKKTSTPLNLPPNSLENLPEQPGVYIFYSQTGMPLYVGKSINLRERILSHFASDIHSPTEMNISQQVAQVETIPTTGELGALLLESQLIKKLLPLYNKKSRIKRELVAVKSKINIDGYKEIYIEPIVSIDPNQLGAENGEAFLGFFKSRKQAKDYLVSILKEYSLCEKLLALEKTKNGCFSYRLSKCKGACVGMEKVAVYNLRFTEAFAASVIKPWPYDGKITIEEKSHDGKSEYFLIDKWCYLGNVKIDEFEHSNEQVSNNLVFDLDTYKILKGFLKNPKNVKRIQRANGQLASLL